MQIIKSEWHQVEKKYSIVIDENLLQSIYPGISEDEMYEKFGVINSGELAIEDLIDEANEAGAEIEWEWLDQDCDWTEIKGGAETTYTLEEEEDEDTSEDYIITDDTYTGNYFTMKTE